MSISSARLHGTALTTELCRFVTNEYPGDSPAEYRVNINEDINYTFQWAIYQYNEAFMSLNPSSYTTKNINPSFAPLPSFATPNHIPILAKVNQRVLCTPFRHPH